MATLDGDVYVGHGLKAIFRHRGITIDGTESRTGSGPFENQDGEGRCVVSRAAAVALLLGPRKSDAEGATTSVETYLANEFRGLGLGRVPGLSNGFC